MLKTGLTDNPPLTRPLGRNPPGPARAPRTPRAAGPARSPRSLRDGKVLRTAPSVESDLRVAGE